MSDSAWTFAVVFISIFVVLLVFGALWVNSHLHS